MPRPVEHVVLVRPKPEATEEHLAELRAQLLGLEEKLPGILHATCGRNFSERSGGYEIGFVVRFADRAALEHYLPHPLHREVVERYVRPHTDGVLVVDYEI